MRTTSSVLPARGFAVWAALPLGALLAAVSLAGLLVPSVYARETASWAAQGRGQDWVDLVVVAPALLLTGTLALHGSLAARVLLGGIYAYVAYSFVLYAMAMHYNVLFLPYCATLGLAFHAGVAHVAGLARDDALSWYPPTAPVRLAAGLLVGQAAAFAALWLREDVAAAVDGVAPASLAEVGLVTNPVHVLDLAIALPALALVGASLWRRRRLGLLLAPTMLGFATLMALALGGMMLSLVRHGLATSAGPAVGFGLMALLCAGALARLVRGLPRRAA